MGNVTIEYPFTDIRGKVHKSDSAYFCHRNGRTFIRRLKNVSKKESTEQQKLTRNKFKQVAARTTEILKDTSSDTYKAYYEAWKAGGSDSATLYGYIFKQEYGK